MERKIIAQLQHYKKKAPYYFATINLLQDIFDNQFEDIVSLNQVSLGKICNYLGTQSNIEVFSKMNLSIEEAHAPDEWALNICKAIGNVDEYWNLSLGQSFFDITKYDKGNINLKFHSINFTEYYQKQNHFESGLSILDVMMFNSPEEIRGMLNNYELI